MWLDKTEIEFGTKARAPVQVFNAGFCMNRSLENELTAMKQPTLIVEGKDDTRQRTEYIQNMNNCQTTVLPGKNVIPWEYPKELAQLIREEND
jgi:hypothetical protein